MKQFIITLAILLTSNFFKAQNAFEKGMQKGFNFMKENKLDDAIAQFERVASVEVKNWLPYYYVTLNNVILAFMNEKDEKKVELYLQKAKKFQSILKNIDQNNSEILVLEAMILTAELTQDPMNNAGRLVPKINELYEKAIKISPENPRAVFGKAEFDFGGAKWTGADLKSICKEINNSIELFHNFKPESAFHPKWGLERAQEIQKKCN